MPTYEYLCQSCEHQFEQFQSITAPPVRTCPKCGKRRVKRLIGIGAGFIFKGSGFYETDYRSESYKTAAKADSDSGSKPKSDAGKADAGKSDSSPAKNDAGSATAPAKSGTSTAKGSAKAK